MLRDQLFVDESAAPGFLTTLRGAGIGQALVLSTCDRVEIQAVHREPSAASAAITRSLAAQAGLGAEMLDGQVYRLEGEEALQHIFSVAASLDSQVIGEPQVFGQVKASHRLAKDHGMSGPDLERVMQAAFAAAKRVRTETAIGERPVSIAAAAVSLARDVHGALDRCTALLIGGDDMGELVAEHLHSAGLGRLLVTAPREQRAEAVAQRFECHVVPFATYAAALDEADIVIASVGTRRYVIDHEMMEQVLKRRRRRPVFLVDAAVPGDIAPKVNEVEEAFLYDLEDLESVAVAGRATRQAAAEEARRIVADEVAAFGRDQAERSAAPALTWLRTHFEDERQKALRDAGGDAERATELLIGRLLHRPSQAMRLLAAQDDSAGRAAAEALLRRLFRLDE